MVDDVLLVLEVVLASDVDDDGTVVLTVTTGHEVVVPEPDFSLLHAAMDNDPRATRARRADGASSAG